MKKTMIDHRKFIRIKDVLVVSYSLPGKSRLEDMSISEDISQGGMRLVVSRSFALKDVMALELTIYSDDVPISLKGRVVWAKEITKGRLLKREKRYELGIEFVATDSFSQDRLSRYLARKARMLKE
jgi:c-di-GMP-binding flagellar brake protein YcgR